jgi:hypothetical protein
MYRRHEGRRRTTRLHGAGAAIVITTTAGLAGCSWSPGADPLPNSGKVGRVQVCADFMGDGVMASGNDTTSNGSDQRLTIDYVTFSHMSGMELLGVKLVRRPAEGGPAEVGLERSWPRTVAEASSDSLKRLARAPDAVGATIPPADGSEVTFTVGVRARPGAEASGLQVGYHDEDGNSFVWVGDTILRAGDPTC